ncbi:hypothetical protein JKP88DRAFT_79423 [Tribonema minus]|uniref:Uncharacterized protein n=1 Tax=Tribonema minus TaxID=303371 RepID=A0A836CB50_9STRA|nr:hypothetical protein JKP88DRAFT_79423 [Tribonema minus]
MTGSSGSPSTPYRRPTPSSPLCSTPPTTSPTKRRRTRFGRSTAGASPPHRHPTTQHCSPPAILSASTARGRGKRPMRAHSGPDHRGTSGANTTSPRRTLISSARLRAAHQVIIAGPTGIENPGGTRVQLTLDPARYVTAADLHVIRDTLRRLRPGMWGIDDSTLARPDLSDEHEAAVGDLARAAKKPKGKGKRRFDGGGGGGPAAKQPRTVKPSPFKRPAPLAAAARAGPESAFKRARTSVQVGGGGRCGGGGGGGSAGGSDWGYGMSRFFMDQREQQLELARQQEALAREQREFQANVLALLQNMQASLANAVAQRAQVNGVAQQLAALQNMLYPEAADNAAQEGAEAGAADAEAEHQDEEEDEGYSA